MEQAKHNWGTVSQYRSQLFGISIIFIMIFHYFEHAIEDSPMRIVQLAGKGYNLLIGSTGVEIFLFLSGMGLYFSMTRTPDIQKFYQKRFQRILIPYLIWGGIFWLWKDILLRHESVGTFLLDYSTLSLWTSGNKNLWYVSFILVMYLLFPLLFMGLKGTCRYRGLVAWGGTILLFAGTIALKFAAPELYDHIEIALYRIPIFLIGAYYGKAIAEKRAFKAIDLLLPALGIALKGFSKVQTALIGTELISNRLVNCFYAFFVMGLLLLILPLLSGTFVEKALLFCGKLSFELYITHVTLRTLMNNYGLQTYHILYYAGCILIAFLLSILLGKLSDWILAKGNPKTA